MHNNITYAVAMSGGIDSSTAAAILLREGYKVFGVTMLTCKTGCDKIILEAGTIADDLGIRHYICDISDGFQTEVVDYFINSYMNGLTPNPCAICNKKIKLKQLLQFARNHGADYLATGHYASIEVIEDQVYLKESINTNKDQSYFISLTSKEDLKYIRFPLSNILNKQETRNLAVQFGLRNFAKQDSQDICFIQNRDYISFIRDNIKDKSKLNNCGNMVLNTNNSILAQHHGLENYTIGQRRGLGVSHFEPLYVIHIDTQSNQIILGNKKSLISKYFKVSNMNWIIDSDQNDIACLVKIRAGKLKFKAIIHKYSETDIQVTLLEQNTLAVCPGQVCALYNKENVILGAGTITHE